MEVRSLESDNNDEKEHVEDGDIDSKEEYEKFVKLNTSRRNSDGSDESGYECGEESGESDNNEKENVEDDTDD